MSRYTNIATGEKYMTEQNALRHYISKAKKAKNRQNYEEMHKLYSEATGILDIDYCFQCSQDDFGYCGLRREKISQEDMFMKYCFDGFIRDMEYSLKDIQGRKERYGEINKTK